MTRAEWDARPATAKLTEGDRCFLWAIEVGEGQSVADGACVLHEVEFITEDEQLLALPFQVRCTRCRLEARISAMGLEEDCFRCRLPWTSITDLRDDRLFTGPQRASDA